MLQWETRGGMAHSKGERPWIWADDYVRPQVMRGTSSSDGVEANEPAWFRQTARVVGAQEAEVSALSLSLSTSLTQRSGGGHEWPHH